MASQIACAECANETSNLAAIGCTNIVCNPIGGGMCSITFDPPPAGALQALAKNRAGAPAPATGPVAAAALIASDPQALHPFPGRLIKEGEPDTAVVSELQGGLAKVGSGPFRAPGVFDEAMTSTVKLFQAQHVDSDGAPLAIDGEVGSLSWSAIFPQAQIPRVFPATEPSTLMLHALGVAGTQVGQMEVPPGSNRGPMVDKYLSSVGIPPNQGTADQRFWCMAFIYWTFQTAAVSMGVHNPLPRTAGCATHWEKAATIPGAVRITRADAFDNVSLIKPGLVAILDFGGGAGHTYIVERLLGSGRIASFEGNSNNDGSRNGVGVFRLERRKLSDPFLVGFVDYSNA